MSDLIDGFIRLMDSPAEVTGPINIGNPVEFSMLELAQLVQEKTGSKLDFQFKPLPQDDPRQRQPDITRARNILGWEPKVALSEGLDRTIDYFRKRLSA